MQKLLIAFIAITLGGCAHQMKRDLPHPPITQEQDTPFIFKERYQVQNTEVTQVVIDHQSDFVDIESTDEFVFWHRASASVDGQPASIKTIHNQAQPLDGNSEEPKAKLLSTIPAVAPENIHNEPKVTVKELLACKPIMCEGSVCGEIAVCEGKPCDKLLHSKYACNDNACALVVDNPTDSAKGESYCNGFEQLDNCPGQTPCNQQAHYMGEAL